MANKPIVISITGGIGSGKTTVANIIRDMGFVVISSDENAKKLINSNDEIKNKLIALFGEAVFSTDGKLNSKYLSQKVFGDTQMHKENLQSLNQIVHPYVIDYLINEVNKYEKNGEEYIFVESALTYEAGLEEGFEYVIVVDSDEDTAIQRVMKRTGLSKQEVSYRNQNQISRQRKKEVADFVIENNSGLEDLEKSTKLIIGIITQL